MDGAMIVSIVSAVVTVSALPFVIWQARTAAVSAREARRQTEAATRQTELQEQIHEASQQPYVWADIAGDVAQADLIKLTVCNEGPTVATNIRVSFDPPLQSTSLHDSFSQVQQDLANSGVRSLPPGRRIEWVFDVGHRFFQGNTTRLTKVTVDCEGIHGNCPTNTYMMDLDAIRNSHNVPYGSFYQLGERVREVVEAIKSVQSRNTD